MSEFTFFWLTGKREVLRGDSPADALNSAGYGGDNDEYIWNPDGHKWDKRASLPAQESAA